MTAWLKQHPEIQVVSRDGSKSYAKAIEAASSDIKQVGDRWHILQQLFCAIKKTLYAYVPSKWIPPVIGEVSSETETNPTECLRKTDQVRIQNEEKHWARIQRAQQLAAEGYSIASIARKMNLSRVTIYKDLKITRKPCHKRESRFDDYRSLIRSLVQKQQTAKQIEEVCRERGYDGSVSTLNTMIARERRNSKNNGNKPLFLRQRLLSIIWNFHGPPHEDCFKHIHSKLLSAFPDILLLNKIVSSFRQLFYSKDPQCLIEWIHQHEKSKFPLICSFIEGLKKDLSAVSNSIQEPWSNGVAEGHVNRLKTIKRMMYGRAKFSLLRIRVLSGL
ncbi:hypothetical protein CEW92_09415 [Bacillaceae bacterium SAS-127]|nr:hypothetical protein CEW92_09415 [Bacillaceae bacterium SAS-127]